MDAAKEQILKIDLCYELDMFEGAYARFANAPKEADFAHNLVVEAFWTHARNLNEFLEREPNFASKGVASARDFTIDKADFPTLGKALEGSINRRISHLHYGRPTEPDAKLIHDTNRAYEVINSAIKEFERRLTPEAKDIWEPRNPPPILPNLTAKHLSTATIGAVSTTMVRDDIKTVL
jgi:hypothetical protein